LATLSQKSGDEPKSQRSPLAGRRWVDLMIPRLYVQGILVARKPTEEIPIGRCRNTPLKQSSLLQGVHAKNFFVFTNQKESESYKSKPRSSTTWKCSFSTKG
jgi:hypothetical protein